MTGKVVSPSIGPARTEADFVAHIDRTIETDPDAGWIFVTDQLDTHRAATLVELVARWFVVREVHYIDLRAVRWIVILRLKVQPRRRRDGADDLREHGLAALAAREDSTGCVRRASCSP